MSRTRDRVSSVNSDDGDDEFFDAEALEDTPVIDNVPSTATGAPKSHSVKTPVSKIGINTVTLGGYVGNDPPITDSTTAAVKAAAIVEAESKAQSPAQDANTTVPTPTHTDTTSTTTTHPSGLTLASSSDPETHDKQATSTQPSVSAVTAASTSPNGSLPTHPVDAAVASSQAGADAVSTPSTTDDANTDLTTTTAAEPAPKHRFDVRYSIDVCRFTAPKGKTEGEGEGEGVGYEYEGEGEGEEAVGLFSFRGEEEDHGRENLSENNSGNPENGNVQENSVNHPSTASSTTIADEDAGQGKKNHDDNVNHHADNNDKDDTIAAQRPSIVTPFHSDYTPQTEQLQQQQQQRMLERVNAAATASAARTSTHTNAHDTTDITPEDPKPEEKKKSGFFSRLLGKDKKAPSSWQQTNLIPVKSRRKSVTELSHLCLLQTVGQHVGAIWCSSWSLCGQLLATGGQDGTVIVWASMGSVYAQEINGRLGGGGSAPEALAIGCPVGGRPVLHPVPYAVFCGHKADVIDLSWSRGNFLLSGSIDKTARLWHLSKPKCLMVFQHTDFVTAVCFHPIEDRYFLSGSFDRKLRVWNIPHHKVVEWTRTPAIVTSACFSPDGYTAVAGLYQGQVMLYHTEQLRYKTQLDCRNRSGKDSGGRKVTGVVFSEDGHYLLVSTNDSRLRLYSMDDYRMVSKYKGLQNRELQIRAHLGPGYTRIVSGSEDGNVYVWETSVDDRKDNHIDSYEYFSATQGVDMGMGMSTNGTASTNKETTMVTCADFVPFATVRGCSGEDVYRITHMIITADANGDMRIYENTLPAGPGQGI